MKKHLTLFLLIILTCLLSTSCSNSKSNNTTNKPQNIILLIGDGMSIPQICASMLTQESPTSFEQFPVTGLVKTHSKSHRITDSAAGGTAIATGHKTNNGMIGMNADSIAVPSMLEIFSDRGMKTGVIATSYITHATPASFVAKNINRNNYEEIAADFANSDKVDLLIVAMHWGVEYTHAPTEYQLDAAEFLSEHNVDVIIGSHPHVIQPVAWVNDTLVFYSLGNFVSAQYQDENYNKMIGLMSSFTVTKTTKGEESSIKIDNIENDLLYTYYNQANWSDFKVVPFSHKDIGKYLPGYESVYKTYKQIVQNIDEDMYVVPLAK